MCLFLLQAAYKEVLCIYVEAALHLCLELSSSSSVGGARLWRCLGAASADSCFFPLPRYDTYLSSSIFYLFFILFIHLFNLTGFGAITDSDTQY
jgi:hypothetical protein